MSENQPTDPPKRPPVKKTVAKKAPGSAPGVGGPKPAVKRPLKTKAPLKKKIATKAPAGVAPQKPTPPVAPAAEASEASGVATAPEQQGKGKGKKNKAPDFHGLEYRHMIVAEYTAMWREFYNYFGEGFEGRRITPQDEEGFNDLVHRLTKRHYIFSELVGKDFSKQDIKAIFDIVCDSISISHLKKLSPSEFDRFLKNWHQVFINMYKALGKIKAEKAAIEAKKKTKASMKKKKKGKQADDEPEEESMA